MYLQLHDRHLNNSDGKASVLLYVVAQWVARLTRNLSVMGSKPSKATVVTFEQETLPSLLSTGWFLEKKLNGFYNRT